MLGQLRAQEIQTKDVGMKYLLGSGFALPWNYFILCETMQLLQLCTFYRQHLTDILGTALWSGHTNAHICLALPMYHKLIITLFLVVKRMMPLNYQGELGLQGHIDISKSYQANQVQELNGAISSPEPHQEVDTQCCNGDSPQTCCRITQYIKGQEAEKPSHIRGCHSAGSHC